MSDQPQVRLKRKVTLRRKEEAAFTFTGRLKVRLLWQSETDLDLCLFFRRKDGEVGGVFSDLFRSRKSDRGALDQFPYILHLGDSPEPGEGSESVEQINVGSLADLEQAYVCIVNYGAATEGRDVTFADESGRVEITSDAGDNLEVQADATESWISARLSTKCPASPSSASEDPRRGRIAHHSTRRCPFSAAACLRFSPVPPPLGASAPRGRHGVPLFPFEISTL